MTATKDRLALELRLAAEKAQPHNAAIYRQIADRAETGEFDDFSDAHVCGPTALHALLTDHGLTRFARRVAAGEFDATLEESETWARSQTDPKMLDLMTALGIAPDRRKDQ